MKLVFVGIDIVLEVDFDVVVHLVINILAKAGTDDRNTLFRLAWNYQKFMKV